MKTKTKCLIILAIAVMLVWGTSYLFLPGSGAQKSVDQITASRGAYPHSTSAVRPDKVEGYQPAPYVDLSIQKAVRGVRDKRQGGEDCATATVVGSLPYNVTGTTVGYLDDYDEVCPYGPHTSPDVVYSYAPGANETVNIDLYGSAYDTKLFVYEDDCVPPYYACNDDYYPDYVSAIMGLDIYAGHTYYIVVDGYGGGSGQYNFLLETVEPCDVVCPGGGIAEGEPVCYDYYDDMYNGGCNSTPNVFQDINCGDIICGTSGTFISDLGNTRDTDWFRVTLTDPTTLTWKVVAEFPLLIFIIEESDCAAPNILGSATADMCDTASLTFDVPAGVYWLWVGPSVFEGVPCGKEYVGEVTCEVAETGACCDDYDPYTCTMETPADCAAMPDHTFLGLGTDCGPPNPCLPGPDNDDCGDAEPVTPGVPVYGSNVGATVDCPGVLDWNAVWYTFTLPYDCNNLFIDFCPTDGYVYTVGVVLYDECPPDCPNYILRTGYQWVTCGSGWDNPQIWWDALPAGTYWFPAYTLDPGGNPMDFGFEITVEECAGPAPNDDCADAIAVSDVTDLPFTTIGATFDGGGTCMSSPNIWYLYTATCNGNVHVDLCGSSYDTKLAAYDGASCNPLDPELACNDDACYKALQSEITFAGVQGNQYLIEVGGYGSNTGDGDLSISCTGPQAGDDCTDPIVVDNIPATLPYTDAGQTNCGRGNTYSSTCLGSYDGGEDIIYQLNVTSACDVDITLDPKSSSYTGFAIDDECPPGDPCMAYSTSSSAAVHRITELHLEPGTYYIMVDTWPSPNCIPEFDLTIEVSTGPQPGDNCGLPIVVELPLELPYMDRDQYTCLRGDNYENTCLGYYDGGEDIIYELTVTAPIYVMVTLDPKGTTYTGIALDGSCPPGDPCMYSSTNSGSDPHGFEADLDAGTYYIMIDTWPSPNCIPDFDLTIDPLGPDIDVSPASFEVVLNPDPPNNTADESMFIGNEGYLDLNYEVSEDPDVAWLSFTPGSGTVLPGMTDPVTVSFDASGMAAGDYYTTLKVASNSVKQLEDTVEVPVHLVVELAPDIDVAPPTISMGVIPGCQMYRSVQVQNAGPGELRFEISVGETPPPLTTGKSNVPEALQALRQAGKVDRSLTPREAYKVIGAKRPTVEYISTGTSEGMLLLAGKGMKADILLVDDDGGTPGGTYYDIEDIYMAALDAGGYVYDYYNVDWTDPLSDGPDLTTMQAYSVVIWFCGESWGYYGLDVLTANDEANLGSYLDGGGNLFLSAQDWLWASYPAAGSFSPGTFPYDYLHLASANQDVINDPYTCAGLPGSVAEGMSFQTLRFTDNPDVPLWTDYLTTQSPAAVDVFDAGGGVSAIQYNPAKGYKVVFTTTPFPGLVDGGSRSTKAELMASIMDWFIEAACPFTVAPEEGTVPSGESQELILTFDGDAFPQCEDGVPPETVTCYLNISSNDPIDPEVSVEVDMWSGRGDVTDPTCLIEGSDVVFLINYVWRGGPAPDPVCMGDCNPPQDGLVQEVDFLYLIQYLYQGGMPPLAVPEIHQPGTIK